MEIKGIDDPNRVVFMGNSITEGWLYFNKSFFENPFINKNRRTNNSTNVN